MTQDTIFKLQSSSAGMVINKLNKAGKRKRDQQEREKMNKFIHSPEVFEMIAEQRKIGGDRKEILIK